MTDLNSAEDVQTLLKGNLEYGMDKKPFNSAVWHISKTIAQRITAARKAGYEEAEKKLKRKGGGIKVLDDDERIERLTAWFEARLMDGTLQPQDIAQFKDIENLRNKEQDVIMQPVMYGDVFPEEAGMLEIARIAMEKHVQEANEG